MNSSKYTTADFAELVEVSKASVKNYVTILEDCGYVVVRDHRNYRQFTDRDVDIFKALIALSKERGLKLKEAAQVVVAPGFKPESVAPQPVLEVARYEDLCQSMELLAGHVYGIEQQNEQLLTLIQAQRQQNELLMTQNNTLKQELGSMMQHLVEKANEPSAMHQQQLDRVEMQNNAIMNVINSLRVEQREQVIEEKPPEKGIFARMMNK
ncbi:hypothetical protein AEA09_03515 [Lysinibacillus contaminans]|uniref:HTH merR-type domain-containing protein n=1 Tax=Lysinibacillus contaminans TaxID=1293441 RepID=A0ABR5JYI8_9BACI|nr:MerR family transcriptional regulator [Lysinibacillus contaminans]KOS67716.1 hypothetical protein AEA09_03515 [Lysinibacillus contaminans]